MAEYFSKIAKSTAVIFIATMLANLFGYFTRGIFTRAISPAEYGLFYSVFTLYMFLHIPADLGLSSALTRYISTHSATNKKEELFSVILFITSVKLFLGLIIAGTLFYLAPYLAANYFSNNAAIPLIQFASVFIILSLFFSFLNSVFSGFQKMTAVGLLYFLQKVIIFFTALVFYLLTQFRGVMMPATSFLVGFFTFLIFLPYAIKLLSHIKANLIITKKMIKGIFSFALPSSLNSLGFYLVGYVDVLMITYFLTLTEVGVYNTVLPTALILSYLASSLAIVMFPVSANLYAKNSLKKLNLWIKRLYSLIAFIIIPPSIIMAVYSTPLLDILFGKAYSSESLMVNIFGYSTPSGPLALSILALGIFMVSIARLNFSIFSGIGKPAETTKIIGVAATVNIILNILLIPKFGISGAAITTTVSYLIMMVMSIIKARRFIDLKFPMLNFLKVIILSILFYVSLIIFSKLFSFSFYLNTLLSITSSGTIYLILGYILKIYSIEDILNLKPNFTKP